MPTPSPLRPANALIAASLTLAAGLQTGCGSSWLASSGPENDAIRPDDFIGEAGSDADDATAASDEEQSTATSTAATDPDADGPRPTSDQALAVDAMVGHINGEALFADQIFDVNLIAQLQSFGQRYDAKQFQLYATDVIQERLRGVVINKLILGEAERYLTEQQRAGIDARVQAEREELIRYYGQGSVSKAKAQFTEARGKELDEHLIAFREELAIGFYIQSKVTPKIVVNQADVRRWFEDHKDQFHRPDQRVLRLIRVQGQAHAQAVKARLDKGEAFEKVAADPALNTFNPDGGGSVNSGEAIAGKTPIGIEPVNKALLPLQSGEHAGPITAGQNDYFVQVVQYTPGVVVTLADAQLDIEKRLRAEQFERHALRFRMDLLKRGSYTDIAQMGNKLLEIARARYDQ